MESEVVGTSAIDAAAKLYNYSHEEFYDFFRSLNYQLYNLSGGQYQERVETFWILLAVPRESSEIWFFENNLVHAASSFAAAME